MNDLADATVVDARLGDRLHEREVQTVGRSASKQRTTGGVR